MSINPYYRSPEGFITLQNLYNDALGQWPIKPTSIYIETRLAKTHLLIVGDRNKPDLFYFHGWNGNAAGNHNDLDLPRLTEKYCVYMPDTPGHTGRSEAVRPDTYGLAFAEWVEDMLDQLNIEQAYLAGVSGGGYIASKAAAHLQSRISRILGIVPYGIPPASRPPLKFLLIAIPSMLLGKHGMRYFARKMGSPTQSANENIDGLAEFMGMMNKHFKPAWNPAPLTDTELQAIICPVDLIFSKHDITMPSHIAAERAHRLIKNVQVQILADEGHILSPQAQQNVNEVLLA